MGRHACVDCNEYPPLPFWVSIPDAISQHLKKIYVPNPHPASSPQVAGGKLQRNGEAQLG